MTTRADDRGRSGVEDERWFLDDEREFLLRSIDDAERERAAGDLSDADYDVLAKRDRARLAEVEAELAALGPRTPPPATELAEPAKPGPAGGGVHGARPTGAGADAPEGTARRRLGPWRRVGVVAASLLILAGAGILVNHAVNPAAPNQPISGSTAGTKQDEVTEYLTAASILAQDGQGKQALQIYNKVLSLDPGDPDALAAGGWLEWNAGFNGKSKAAEAAGRSSEEKAVKDGPSFYGGHLYLGLILLDQDDNAAGAVQQFTAFLADAPPTSVLKSYAPHIAPAWEQLHEPLPAAVAKYVSTTSTTTTTTTPAS